VGKARRSCTKILFQGKDYVVETKILGVDWRNSKLNKKQTIEALENLGTMLKKMHSVKTKKYGYIIKPGVGQYNTWKEFMEKYLALRLDKIKKLKYVSSNRLNKISAYLIKNEDLLNLKNPRLCHKDVNKGNIMINNGKISGIIDASDAVSGDPAFDTGIIYQRFGKEMFKHFVKTYGKIDLRKVEYYAILNALRKIPLDHHNGNLEACERHLEQIERIIG
jgi:aminoglycoside phosphotransferase (APT) family kinase protein